MSKCQLGKDLVDGYRVQLVGFEVVMGSIGELQFSG